MEKKGPRTTSINQSSKFKVQSSKCRKAVFLLSGGIDSSTSLAIANAEGYELYALSFDYNQRHKIELESARKVAAAMGAKKHLIIKFDLREIGGSALTAEMEVPKNMMHYTGFKMHDKKNHESCIMHHVSSNIPITYVPARNTIFLSFALAWAEVAEAEDIFIGANAVDYSGYPDCRPEYLKAFEAMANLATKASIGGKMKFKINAPLITISKAEIIRKGTELGLDYSLTWSCYDPQPKRVQKSEVRSQKSEKVSKLPSFQAHYVPCGRCDSCIFRAKGFAEAGIKDPLLK